LRFGKLAQIFEDHYIHG